MIEIKAVIDEKIAGSFRDPNGFVFTQDGLIYRQVNKSYKDNYDHLMKSGLYEALVKSRLLIPHEEIDLDRQPDSNAYVTLKPERVAFISYPYEWSFGQLKDAALTTLKIQKTALGFGMALKDGSAYNIQFVNGKPIFIDTLSFERYKEGEPWVAYRQFCQHFLAPLALMSYKDIRLNQLLRVYIDGIPLDLASSLLPSHTYLKSGLLLHIHLHSKSQARYADKGVSKESSNKAMGMNSLLGLISTLENAIKRLNWNPKGTEWADYLDNNSYDNDAIEHKKQIVATFLDKVSPKTAWDIGANVGLFSRIASNKGIETVSFDIDPAAVEKNYRACVDAGDTLLPLVLDLTNPSPGIGWDNQERLPVFERGHADVALALALIHHLAISNNVPLGETASFFHRICNWLIIEFVPKSDVQVKRLLATREDVFPDYKQQAFEEEFRRYFTIHDHAVVMHSDRILYLMEAR